MKKLRFVLFVASMTMLAACGKGNATNEDTENGSATETATENDDAVDAESLEVVTEEPADQTPVDDSTLTANDEQAVFEVIKAIHTQDDNKKYAAEALRKKISDGYHTIGLYDYGTDGMVEWSIVPNSLKITSFDPSTGKVKYTLKVKCFDKSDDSTWEDTHNETATVVKVDGEILVSESSTLQWWS